MNIANFLRRCSLRKACALPLDLSRGPGRRKKRSIVVRLGAYAAADDRGQSMVEFALVAPLLMLLLTGTFMFGMALNNYLALTNAVEIGAQQLSLLRGNSSNPCADTVTAVENAAPGLTASSLTFTITLGGTAYGSSCASVALTPAESATLKVTYPATVSPFGMASQTYSLAAQTTELIQ